MMISNLNKRWQGKNIFLIAVFLFSSVFLLDCSVRRIHYMPITFDEVTSLQRIQFNGTPPPSSNNHPLNTLCMKAELYLFGDSVAALRMHSVIAQGIWLLSA